MDKLRSDLSSRWLDYDVIDPKIQKIIEKNEERYKELSENKKHEYIDKLIDILADAENNINQLKTDIWFQSYIDLTNRTLTMVRIGVDNPELMDIRDKLYRMDNLDPIPERNNPINQIIIAIYDEIIYWLWDLALTLYKEGGKWGLFEIVKQIWSALVSVELYQTILKESWTWIQSFIFDWTWEDMVYRKFRQWLIIAGIPALIKGIWKKILSMGIKKSLAIWVWAIWTWLVLKNN